MKSNVLIAIVAATIPVVGLAYWVITKDAQKVQASGVIGPLFPTLEQDADRVATIRIQRSETPFTVSRASDASWFLPGRSNYPAKIEKARTLVQALVKAKIVEERTSDPSKYTLIGVQDAGVRGENDMFSGLVELLDKDGKPVASLLVGQAKSQAGFVIDSERQQVYVRKPGEAKSWLVTGPIEVDTEDLAWADRETVNLQKERVKSATITRNDGTKVGVARESAQQSVFTVGDVPAGRELRFPGAPDQIASVLSFLTFDDVKPVGDIDFSKGDPAASGKARVECLDGLVIEAEFAKIDGKTWVRLAPAFDAASAVSPAANPTPTTPTSPDKAKEHKGPKTAEEAKKDVETITERFVPWAYQVSDYKASSFTKSLDDMLKPMAGDKPSDLPEGMEGLEGLPMPLPMEGPAGPGLPAGVPAPPRASGPK